MAHVLQLASGSFLDSLVGSGRRLTNYMPSSGKPGDTSVTDRIEVLFLDTSPINVRDKKRNIERYFEMARRYQRLRSGDRVYLQFQLHTDSEVYRSEVLDGRIDLMEDSVQESALNYIEAVIYITRRPYWEGSATALTLTNGSGSNNTGLTIYNHDDGTAGHDNWALIGNTAIAGSLPAPLQIEIKNLGTRQVKNVHICIDSLSSSSQNLVAILEGEAGGVSGGASTAGSYSNGSTMSFNVNTTNAISWTIPSATIGYLAGRNIKFLGKFTFSGTVYAQVSLSIAGLTVVKSPEVRLNTQDYIQDLGTIPVVPGYAGTGWADISLIISFRSTSNVAMTCDFVQMTFADDFCYRYLTSVAASWLTLDVNDTIMDDGIEELAFVYSATTIIGRIPMISARGNPIYVNPFYGYQKLRFLIDGNSTNVDWTFSVRAWYRPRVNLPV